MSHCNTCIVGTDTRDPWISLIAVSSIIGMIVSFYSILAHYNVASGEFCSINATFDCDIVNQSAYSEIFGIPVSILGLLAYAVLFVGVMIYHYRPSERLIQMLFMLSVGGVVFSLYLTSIEAFVLYTWCILCLVSQAMILISAGSLFRLQKL